MHRKLVTLLGAALLTCAVTASLAHAGGRTASTLDLAVDGRHAVRTYVDAAPKHRTGASDDSPGDTVVMHAPLLDRSGRRVGSVDATFVTTAAGPSTKQGGTEQLTGTLKLMDGQIAILGNVGAHSRTSHVAIVGGTGRYASARGVVTAHFSPRAVILHVILT